MSRTRSVGWPSRPGKRARPTETLSQVQNELSSFLGSLEKRGRRPARGSCPDTIKGSIGRSGPEAPRAAQSARQKETQALADRRQFQSFLDLRTQAQLHAAEFELRPRRPPRVGSAMRPGRRWRSMPGTRRPATRSWSLIVAAARSPLSRREDPDRRGLLRPAPARSPRPPSPPRD